MILIYLKKMIFFINIGIRVSLCAPRLIPQALKLTIMILITTPFEIEKTKKKKKKFLSTFVAKDKRLVVIELRGIFRLNFRRIRAKSIEITFACLKPWKK